MINLNLKRPTGGAAILIVDAREFHTYLETLGCRPERSDGTGFYANRPAVYRDRLVDIDADKLTTNALLKVGGPHTIDLGTVFGAPPNAEKIFRLLDRDSLHALARSIVDHYRPIEIQVSIVAKRPAPRSEVSSGAGSAAATPNEQER